MTYLEIHLPGKVVTVRGWSATLAMVALMAGSALVALAVLLPAP